MWNAEYGTSNENYNKSIYLCLRGGLGETALKHFGEDQLKLHSLLSPSD